MTTCFSCKHSSWKPTEGTQISALALHCTLHNVAAVRACLDHNRAPGADEPEEVNE